MIQIELPCCGAACGLEPDGETVRCEACAVEHLLAPDARPDGIDAATPAVAGLPAAA